MLLTRSLICPEIVLLSIPVRQRRNGSRRGSRVPTSEISIDFPIFIHAEPIPAVHAGATTYFAGPVEAPPLQVEVDPELLHQRDARLHPSLPTAIYTVYTRNTITANAATLCHFKSAKNVVAVAIATAATRGQNVKCRARHRSRPKSIKSAKKV